MKWHCYPQIAPDKEMEVLTYSDTYGFHVLRYVPHEKYHWRGNYTRVDPQYWTLLPDPKDIFPVDPPPSVKETLEEQLHRLLCKNCGHAELVHFEYGNCAPPCPCTRFEPRMWPLPDTLPEYKTFPEHPASAWLAQQKTKVLQVCHGCGGPVPIGLPYCYTCAPTLKPRPVAVELPVHLL